MEMQNRYGKTKIVCTLGPASSTVDVIEKMVRAGMDVARLNFSHGTHEEHYAMMKAVREAAGRAGEPITILQDLQGPKIRTGKLSCPKCAWLMAQNSRSRSMKSPGTLSVYPPRTKICRRT